MSIKIPQWLVPKALMPYKEEESDPLLHGSQHSIQSEMRGWKKEQHFIQD